MTVGELKEVLNSIEDSKELKVYEIYKHKFYLLLSSIRECSNTVTLCIEDE